MLDVTNLGVRFEQTGGKKSGRLTVIDNLSFHVSTGEFVTVLGPSGCGKTTLLRVIVGLHHAEQGTIRVAGKDKYLPGVDVCMVFQSYGLFPWRTVRENIEFGLKMRGVPLNKRREVSDAYIDLVELRGFEDYYPHQISGGMQQRVGLARALACKPPLLLMDEPFAAVDAQTRERLQGELLRMMENVEETCTVVFVTHSIEEAVYLGSRVLILSSAPSRIIHDMKVDFGPQRWKNNIRSDSRFDAWVKEARTALQQGTVYASR